MTAPSISDFERDHAYFILFFISRNSSSNLKCSVVSFLVVPGRELECQIRDGYYVISLHPSHENKKKKKKYIDKRGK